MPVKLRGHGSSRENAQHCRELGPQSKNSRSLFVLTCAKFQATLASSDFLFFLLSLSEFCINHILGRSYLISSALLHTMIRMRMVKREAGGQVGAGVGGRRTKTQEMTKTSVGSQHDCKLCLVSLLCLGDEQIGPTQSVQHSRQ